MNLEVSNQEEDIEVNMSPMIDMVFLLLIFFIVASTVIDDKVKVQVPAANYAKVPEDISDRFVISVTKDGTMYVQKKSVTLDQLKALLEPEVKKNPELRIMIRADGDVKYKVNEKIVETCAELGAVDLIYSAFEKI